MRKNPAALVVLALSVGLVAVVAYANPFPEEVVIGEAAKEQPPVTFPHAAHTKVVKSCDTCHHTNKGLTAANEKGVKKCSACHLNPEGDVPSMKVSSMKKNPFHIRCVGCHKAEKKGPTACKGCHKKPAP